MRKAEDEPSGRFALEMPEPLWRLFFECNDRLMDRLGAALAACDIAAALDLIHALKGAAMFAGLQALAEAAADAELHLRAGEPDAAAAAIAQAPDLIGAARRAS